jgi:hypothetical protein
MGKALNRRGCIHICPDLRGPPDFRHRIRTRADGAIGQHKRPPHRTCHPVAAAGFFRIEPEARPDSGNEFKGTDFRSAGIASRSTRVCETTHTTCQNFDREFSSMTVSFACPCQKLDPDVFGGAIRPGFARAKYGRRSRSGARVSAARSAAERTDAP